MAFAENQSDRAAAVKEEKAEQDEIPLQ